VGISEEWHMSKEFKKRPDGPFVIQISEAQRKLIIRALIVAANSPDFAYMLKQERDPAGLEDRQLGVLNCIRSMLTDLPNSNEVSDDDTWGAHGFIVHCFNA
jgi:hypothetical protein